MTIVEMRKAQGLSQDDVADALGVRQAYYSRIERGQANPTFDKTIELARILDVGIGTLAKELARTRAAALATLPAEIPDPGFLSLFRYPDLAAA